MANYFRITSYHKEEDYCFIIDSYGKFEKLWQFSSYLVNKGLQILEVSKDGDFTDGNIPRAEYNETEVILRACLKGKPERNRQEIRVGERKYEINCCSKIEKKQINP